MNGGEQYTVWQMLGIWPVGGAPMWILGWLVYRVVSKGLSATDAGLSRLRLMNIGLVWQVLLSMLILYSEEGNILWAAIRHRYWLPPQLARNRPGG